MTVILFLLRKGERQKDIFNKTVELIPSYLPEADVMKLFCEKQLCAISWSVCLCRVFTSYSKGASTLSTKTFRIMSFSIVIILKLWHCLVTLSVMTIIIMTFSIIIGKCDTQHDDTQHNDTQRLCLMSLCFVSLCWMSWRKSKGAPHRAWV
jgi:hypothetical protein